MNEQDTGEWTGVERRESGERRDPGPPQHVEIDGVSNGARSLVERAIATGEEAVKEAKKTRRWIVTALAGVGMFVFAAGEFRGETRLALSNRPTEQAVLEMVQKRDSTMIALVHSQQNQLERLLERSRSHDARLGQVEDDHRRGIP